MNRSDIALAVDCCTIKCACATCPLNGNPECIKELMLAAKNELEKSEVNTMPNGCVDVDEERERLIAERKKMAAEIDYQRRQLAEVLQENKLLEAQMHIVHMIFGRRYGANE